MISSTFNSDNSENVAYNNPLFPVYIRKGILSTYPNYSAMSHWHEDIEYILILSGSMTYNINGKLVKLTEGNGILVNSRQLHYGFSPSHSECVFICILLHPTLLNVNEWFYNNFIEAFLSSNDYPFLYLDSTIEWKNQILQSLNKLSGFSELLAQTKTHKKESQMIYFEILHIILFNFETLYRNITIENNINEDYSAEITTLKKMLTYIKEHYAEKITLERISSSGTCCKSKCTILFKKYMNETPISYTTKYRLHKSLTNLINSNESISHIAYSNGFCSSSYYCETFQKYYKMSPLKYRKLNS